MSHSPEVQDALNRFAATDLRIARKAGLMSVCQTKAGLLDVRYDRSGKTYDITGRGVERLAMKAAEATAVLVSLYDVQIG